MVLEIVVFSEELVAHEGEPSVFVVWSLVHLFQKRSLNLYIIYMSYILITLLNFCKMT